MDPVIPRSGSMTDRHSMWDLWIPTSRHLTRGVTIHRRASTSDTPPLETRGRYMRDFLQKSDAASLSVHCHISSDVPQFLFDLRLRSIRPVEDLRQAVHEIRHVS